MTITARFVPKQSASGRGPVADAFIEFHGDSGPFAGMEINGFAIWSGEKGIFATGPSRDYQNSAGERKKWDFVRLRSDANLPDNQKWALKNWLVDQYKKTLSATSEEVPF